MLLGVRRTLLKKRKRELCSQGRATELEGAKQSERQLHFESLVVDSDSRQPTNECGDDDGDDGSSACGRETRIAWIIVAMGRLALFLRPITRARQRRRARVLQSPQPIRATRYAIAP